MTDARLDMCELMIRKQGVRTARPRSAPCAPAAMKSAQAMDARTRMASVVAMASSSPD
jgi:hypothetical protein